MGFVRDACLEIVALDFGIVIASGSPESVLEDPAVRTAFFGQPA